MYKAKAYSAASATSRLASTTVPRRDTTENDVQIEILFCASATPTSTRSATSGTASCPRSTRLSPVTKSSPGHQRSVSASRGSKRATWWRRLPGRFGPHLSQLPDGLEQLCPNQTLTSTPRTNTWGASPTADTPKVSSSMNTLCSVFRQPRSCRCGTAALRRYQRPTRHHAAGATSRQEGRCGRPRWPGSHGGQVRPCFRSSRLLYSPPRPARRRCAPPGCR